MNHTSPVFGSTAVPQGASTSPSTSVKNVKLPVGVIRPIRSLPALVNHRSPPGPVVMPTGFAMLAWVKVVMSPAEVILPIRPLVVKNRSLPEAVMSPGWTTSASASVKDWTVDPSVVIRPIVSSPRLVNQSAPSPPDAMWLG